MVENPRQARNFTTNVPKILDLKFVFRTDIFQKLTLVAPEILFLATHHEGHLHLVFFLVGQSVKHPKRTLQQLVFNKHNERITYLTAISLYYHKNA